MITAQDIREKGFERAKFGGYDMDAVDDFLEEVADSIGVFQKENSNLQKENASLQKEKAEMAKKMKVLVDKITEYRNNEEALNLAVLSAQKLAVQIESEARSRANAMLAEADKKVKAKVGSIEEQTLAQEKRLADAKAATSKFFEGVRAMCNTQLKNIDAISSGIIPQPEVSKKTAGKKNVEEKTIDEFATRIQDDSDVKEAVPGIKAPIADDGQFDLF